MRQAETSGRVQWRTMITASEPRSIVRLTALAQYILCWPGVLQPHRKVYCQTSGVVDVAQQGSFVLILVTLLALFLLC